MSTNFTHSIKAQELVEYLLRQPNFLNNHLSATENEIKRLSLTNRRKIYNYHAFADLVKSSSQAANIIIFKLYDNHERVKFKTTAFLAAGRLINAEFKRNRLAINMRSSLNELLESTHLINICTRNKFYTGAVAVVNILNSLELYARTHRKLNWLFTDMFSEVEERAVTLRLSIVQVLNKPVPLSNSFGYTSSLNLLDTIFSHQNFPNVNNFQERFLQQEIILQLPCKLWHLFSECATRKVSTSGHYASSFTTSNRLEITSRFHAMFCLKHRACHYRVGAEPLKYNEFRHYNASPLLISWLSRHMLGTSREFNARVFRCKSTFLQSLIDPYLLYNTANARMGASYAPFTLKFVLIKIRSLVYPYCVEASGIMSKNRHGVLRRSLNRMLDEILLSLNTSRLCTPVVFEMENNQLLQDMSRETCKVYGLVPYSVSLFVSLLLRILHCQKRLPAGAARLPASFYQAVRV